MSEPGLAVNMSSGTVLTTHCSLVFAEAMTSSQRVTRAHCLTSDDQLDMRPGRLLVDGWLPMHQIEKVEANPDARDAINSYFGCASIAHRPRTRVRESRGEVE